MSGGEAGHRGHGEVVNLTTNLLLCPLQSIPMTTSFLSALVLLRLLNINHPVHGLGHLVSSISLETWYLSSTNAH